MHGASGELRGRPVPVRSRSASTDAWPRTALSRAAVGVLRSGAPSPRAHGGEAGRLDCGGEGREVGGEPPLVGGEEETTAGAQDAVEPGEGRGEAGPQLEFVDGDHDVDASVRPVGSGGGAGGEADAVTGGQRRAATLGHGAHDVGRVDADDVGRALGGGRGTDTGTRAAATASSRIRASPPWYSYRATSTAPVPGRASRARAQAAASRRSRVTARVPGGRPSASRTGPVPSAGRPRRAPPGRAAARRSRPVPNGPRAPCTPG